MQTDVLIATLFSDPALKNELEWVLGHWSPIQGAQVYQPLGSNDLQRSQVQHFVGSYVV
jgi:hypothetical protein